MTKTSTKNATKPAATKDPAKVLIVLGYGEDAKPRAARFADADPDLVAKAAKAMNLEVREATTPELLAIAKKLPVGRLYGTGTGFVPNVRQDLYSSVIVQMATQSWDAEEPPTPPVPTSLARTFDEIVPGHVVVAQETLEHGWWEATVLARTGDLFTLRFRNFPDLPRFVRHRSAVALIGLPAE